jgi:hypothetical protein
MELGKMDDDAFADAIDTGLLHGKSAYHGAAVGAARSNEDGPVFVCLQCMGRCHVDVEGQRYATDTSLPDGVN